MAPDPTPAIIERLTQISMDIKSMLAVHEQRLTQHEKAVDNIAVYIEKRRDELDQKLKDVYETIRTRDDRLLEEIKASREEHNKHYNCLNEKFNTIQRYIWMAIGGGVALGYGFSFIANYFKVLGH